jgi:GNAT superfamily N-acetyltransferase
VEAARPATGQDLGRLAELAGLARDELRVSRGGEVWRLHESRADPLDASIAASLADPDQRVLAGTLDDVVVGYAAAHIETLRDGGGRLGVIDDLYVEPEARGVGVGEALVGDMIAWLQESGCRGADGLALPGMRATKNFFEAFGFTARAIVVHRSFEEPG